MNIFGGRKNLKNGRGGPLEIGDDVFFVPYGGKRIFSEGRDDGICFILKSLEEQCVQKIYICLHPLFNENETEMAFEICNANGNKLVNQQLCFKSQIILANGRIDLMFMNDKHRRMVYFKLNLTCYE